MNFKTIVKRIIPQTIMHKYHSIKYLCRLFPLYYCQMKRFHNASLSEDDEETSIGRLTMAFHTIEKGFSMPDFRPGFGASKLSCFLDMAEEYLEKFGKNNIQIHHIAECVNDYKKCHSRICHEIEKPLADKIDKFLENFGFSGEDQVQIDKTSADYFPKEGCGFREFALSRHSCRNFSEEPVDIELIKKAVELAQCSPSACNRQPARIYLLSDKKSISRLLKLHKGNRGFGDKVDKLIVISGYMGCYGPSEFNSVFLDCGIFTMNLAYALHYYKIGACILNWSVLPEYDKEARAFLPIGEKEQICALIACGNVPEQFKVCRSGKKSLESVFTEIK